MSTPRKGWLGMPPGELGMVAAGLLTLVLFGLRTVTTREVWAHLVTGRWVAAQGVPRADTLSFTAEGAPWVAGSWLYDLLLYRLWSAGPALAILVHVAAVLAAFVLVVRLARAWAGGIAIGWALLLSAWLIAPVFEVSPRTLSLVFPALFLVLLSGRPPRWALWAVLVPAQALWTNLHGSFLLGPVIAAAFLFDAVRAGRAGGGAEPAPVRPLALLTAALLAATLLNPYGPRLHAATVRSWTDPALNFVLEWISPFSAQFNSRLTRRLITLALAVGASGLITDHRRLPAALIVVAALSAGVALFTGYQIQLFSLLAFPLFALSIGSGGRFLLEVFRKALAGHEAPLRRAAAWAGAAMAALSLGMILTNEYYRLTGSAAALGLGVNEDLTPAEAAPILEHPDFPERAAHLAADGSYLAWRYPDRKVMLDQRVGIHPVELHKRVADGLAGDTNAWQSVMAEWNPEAVILNGTWPGAGKALRNLLRTPAWRLAYFDGTTAVAVRPTPERLGLLQNTALREHGLRVLEQERARYREAVQRPRGAPVSARLVGAANFLFQLERFAEAAAAYDLVTTGASGMDGAWFQLGVARLQMGDVDKSVQALEEACRRLDKNVQPWLWLSRAYAEGGLAAEAEIAYQRAVKLDAAEAERFGNPAKPAPAAP